MRDDRKSRTYEEELSCATYLEKHGPTICALEHLYNAKKLTKSKRDYTIIDRRIQKIKHYLRELSS